MDINKQIGARFRELRKALGYTLRQVSDDLGEGWSFPFLGALERGDRRWSYDQIEELARYYNIPPPLITDPAIPLEHIRLIGQILAELANAPEERLSAFLQMLRSL